MGPALGRWPETMGWSITKCSFRLCDKSRIEPALRVRHCAGHGRIRTGEAQCPHGEGPLSGQGDRRGKNKYNLGLLNSNRALGLIIPGTNEAASL